MKDFGSNNPWNYGKGETWNNANYYSGKEFKLPSKEDYQELANSRIETSKEGYVEHYKMISPYNGVVLYMDSNPRWTSSIGWMSYYCAIITSDNKIRFNSNYERGSARYILLK